MDSIVDTCFPNIVIGMVEKPDDSQEAATVWLVH